MKSTIILLCLVVSGATSGADTLNCADASTDTEVMECFGGDGGIESNRDE